jgi:Acyl-CoA carboxylase epsilon subunit
VTDEAVLRVESGGATPEEIAAVVAAVATTAGADSSSAGTSPGGTTADGGSASRTTSLWSAPGYAHRNIRATFTPGPHGWRTSFWPR